MSGVITYNLNIPNAPNNPSNDQPLMKDNTNNNSAIWAVDHSTFGENFSGTHEQLTFQTSNIPGAGVTDPKSIGFTASSAALPNVTSSASPVVQPFFANQNSGNVTLNNPFPLMMIKAYAVFDLGAGTITPVNAFNITSIVNSNATTWTITMPTNIVFGTNYGVLLSPLITSVSLVTTFGYQITNNTTFTILSDGNITRMTFCVIQI